MHVVKLGLLHPISEQSVKSHTPVKIKAPNELPKDAIIRKLKDNIISLSAKDSVEKVKHDIDEIETINIELEHKVARLIKENEYLKLTYKDLYDSISKTFEQAKALQPLDGELDFVCQHATRIPKLLVYVTDTCPSANKPSEKLVVVTPLNKTKKVSSTSTSGSKPPGNTKKNMTSRPSSSNQKNKLEKHLWSVKSSLNKKNGVSKPVCNANVKHSMLKVNSELIYATCNECLFAKNHDMCVLAYVNDVNVRSKSKSAKHSKQRTAWKPTGKVFTNVGYRWKPIGRTFTIDGNKCPLTRFTSTKVVPLKETTIKSVFALNQETKIYSRRPKPSKSVGPNSWVLLDSGMTIFAKIMGFGDYQMGNVTISRVYYVEGLGYNLFFVGQFCDSDLEVAFGKHTCYICDLEGVDLLKGSRGSNLYTLSLENMMLSSPICLYLKPQRPNIGYGIEGKSKKHSHKPKAEDFIQEKLYLLHIDLCRPMWIQRINGRKYILVIVDDYSRFTWVKFLRSKDEVPEFVIKFMKMIKVHLNAIVRNIRTDNGTKKPDLSYLRVFGALCYPTNDSEDLRKLKPKADIGIFSSRILHLLEFHIVELDPFVIRLYHSCFILLYHQINKSQHYAPAKKAFRIYNKRTCLIIETIHVDFDELTAMASKQNCLGPRPQLMTPGTISSGLVQNPPSPTPYIPPIKDDWDTLFQPMIDEYFNPPPSVDHPVPAVAAP
ncbi:retrovirus-related pol polyprotein from transposon TNT 1-94 [Tanacetum coccineum]